jgi:hypothetical protein
LKKKQYFYIRCAGLKVHALLTVYSTERQDQTEGIQHRETGSESPGRKAKYEDGTRVQKVLGLDANILLSACQRKLLRLLEKGGRDR